ncbi:BUD13 homolog [Osmerus eperlanus]|uniref:BUD13 homolog n=1 Tax=Osmerus eperlanus TaxID=29151 RepID=UPI002E13BC1D
MALWKPSLAQRNVLPDLSARKCKMQAQHLGAGTCRHPDLVMQQEVMRGMAIAPGPAVGPAVDPVSGPARFSRHTFRSRHDARSQEAPIPQARSRHDARSREAPSPQARSRHEARRREAPSPQARSRHEDPSPQARSRHDARSQEAPSPQARSRHDARSQEAPSPQARGRVHQLGSSTDIFRDASHGVLVSLQHHFSLHHKGDSLFNADVVQHRSSSNNNTDAFRVHSHFTVEAVKPKRNKN